MVMLFCKSAGFIPSMEELIRLLEITGGNALAIKLVLSSVGERCIPFIQFINDLKAASGSAEVLFKYLFSDSLSIANINVETIFKAMGLFATHASRDALRKVCSFASENQFLNAISEAIGLSLIEKSADNQIFFMHEIAQYHSQSILLKSKKKFALMKRYREFYANFCKACVPVVLTRDYLILSHEKDNLIVIEAERKNIHRAVQNAIQNDDQKILEPLIKIMFHFSVIGYLKESTELLEDCMKYLEQKGMRNKNEIELFSLLLGWLGRDALDQGDFEKAIKLHKQSLEIIRRKK